MCVPGSPAGCGPENSTVWSRSISGVSISQPGPVHRYTAPVVNRGNTRNPETKVSQSSRAASAGSAENGRVSIAVTKMEHGLLCEGGTRLNGLVRNAVHNPDCCNLSATWSRSRPPICSSDTGSKQTSSSPESSRRTTTDSSTRRAPRLMAVTVPCPGEQYWTFGSRLSMNKGCPSPTRSPTDTNKRGFRPR